MNAGLRLWQVQKVQGTGLCIGADPHFEPDGVLNEAFYRRFAEPGIKVNFAEILRVFLRVCNRQEILLGARPIDTERAAIFLSGVIGYFLQVINAAWQCGIRVFKPQSAFYERFDPIGSVIKSIVCRQIDSLARSGHSLIFKILDVKRGDVELTQEPYFAVSLTASDDEVCPGIPGQYGFDAMTITTWMGENVLMPGRKYFEQGNGAIVVTRSSNPSGTTLQDAYITPNPEVQLSAKQEPFRYRQETHEELVGILGRQPMAHELMLFLTERFSREQGLNEDRVSPIFSVMGSTVKMLPSFRQLRPSGIALIPGYGGQKGEESNVIPLYVSEGPLRGHIGIKSSSRNHNFPWMTKFGGSGRVEDLDHEMERVITEFRANEKQAYLDAGLEYPF